MFKNRCGENNARTQPHRLGRGSETQPSLVICDRRERLHICEHQQVSGMLTMHKLHFSNNQYLWLMNSKKQLTGGLNANSAEKGNDPINLLKTTKEKE